MERIKTKKNIPGYPLLLIFILLLGVLATIVMMNRLYEALTVFEKGTPGAAVNHWFERLANGDYESIREESGFVPGEYSSPGDFDAFVSLKFGGIDPESDLFSYRQVASNEPDGRRVYVIYYGGEKRGEIYLYEDEERYGGRRIDTPLTYLPPYTVKAPSFVTVSVNGKALSPADASERREPDLSLLSELPPDFERPALLTYKVDGFLFEPELTAIAPPGAECVITFSDPDTMEVSLVAGGDLKEALAARMEAVATVYAKYISGAETLSSLSAYMLPGTDFYTRMVHFDHQWHYLYQIISVGEAEVYGLAPHSADCVTGNVDLVSQVRRGADILDYKLSYAMSFVLVDGQWMLLALNVLQ